MNDIGKIQLKIIRDCSNYLQKLKKKNIDIAVSPLCFFTTWAKNPGNLKLRNLLKKPQDFLYILKNILSVAKNHDLEVFYNKNYKKKNNVNIIISYSTKKNFDNKGNFYDYYFSISNKKKNILWFLVSLDNFIPKKINENIIIISKQKPKSISIKYFIKNLLNLLIVNKFSFLKFIHYCWFEYDFAKKISSLFHKTFKEVNIKKVLINYEGIPFQNLLFRTIKKKNKNIKTFGYLHCAPWPLQIDLLYKNFLIDKLFVSGLDQKRVLQNNLGWSKKNLKVVPSLRFKKNKNKEFAGYIFFPYNLSNTNDYLERFENFLLKSSNQSLGKLKIRIHPLNRSSNVHMQLKKKFEEILVKEKSKFIYKVKSLSLFFGSATGVCVQSLEEGTEIIHFPDNETDVFSSKLWKNINVKQIDTRTFYYKIKNFKKTFLVNSEKNKFNKYMQLN